MDPLTIAAAAGTRARLETLDLLANNIANSNTAGFKADREFYGIYLSADTLSSMADPGRPLPTDLPEIEHHWTDYSQGVLTGTGNPLDLAISGEGFFEILTAGGSRWTRNGSFRIGRTGKLETQQGDTLQVVPPLGRDFTLDGNKPYLIGKNGEILQDGQLLGTIRLQMPGVAGDQQLEKQGTSYFKADGSSTPAPASGAEIHQGFLESANSDVAGAAVRLVSVMRQFEMLQKATNLGSDMNKQSIQEVGRIGN